MVECRPWPATWDDVEVLVELRSPIACSSAVASGSGSRPMTPYGTRPRSARRPDRRPASAGDHRWSPRARSPRDDLDRGDERANFELTRSGAPTWRSNPARSWQQAAEYFDDLAGTRKPGQLVDVGVGLAEVAQGIVARSRRHRWWPRPGREDVERGQDGGPGAGIMGERSSASSATSWPTEPVALDQVVRLVEQDRLGQRPGVEAGLFGGLGQSSALLLAVSRPSAAAAEE